MLVKPLRKLEKRAASRPFLLFVVGCVLGGLAYGWIHRLRSGEGPWLGFAYVDKSFSGVPLLLTAKDLNLSWGSESPHPFLPGDHFAIKWVSCLKLSARTYVSFSVSADDAAQVSVDGETIISDWDSPAYKVLEKAVPLSAGTHLITVAHRDHAGGASVSFKMRLVDSQGPTIGGTLLKFPGRINDPANACAYVE